MIQLKQILCPVDFSEFSRRALDHALAVARCYGSTVTALHVASPMPVVVPGPSYFGAETPPGLGDVFGTAREHRARQGIGRAVGHFDGFVEIFHAHYREHRPENFFLCQAMLGADVFEDRQRHEVSLAALPIA